MTLEEMIYPRLVWRIIEQRGLVDDIETGKSFTDGSPSQYVFRREREREQFHLTVYTASSPLSSHSLDLFERCQYHT
jgi:hypothetical protein